MQCMHDRCQSDIVIIQGDTYQKNVLVEGVLLDTIEGVYFSCGKLNISKELTFDENLNAWVLLFTHEETQSFKPIVTDYDITVKLFGNNIKTGLHRGRLQVSEKNNPVEAF